MPHLGNDATQTVPKRSQPETPSPTALHTVQTVFVPPWNHQGVDRAPARGKRSQHARHICMNGLLKRRQPLFSMETPYSD